MSFNFCTSNMPDNKLYTGKSIVYLKCCNNIMPPLNTVKI